MEPCTRCGAALEVGRYCVNCGHPRGRAVAQAVGDGWRTGTAERAAVRVPPAPPASLEPPVPPVVSSTPPVSSTPQRARFPLYADEPAPAETTDLLPAQAWDTAAPGPAGSGHRAPGRRSVSARVALPVAAAVLLLLLVAVTGVFLLRGDDEPSDAATAVSTATDDASPQPATPPPSETPTAPAPTSDPTRTPRTPTPPPEPEDVTRGATALAPTTAPPGVDVDGNSVRYDATNMLDGQDDTAWRAPGDASGVALTFTLDAPTRLTSLGLVNGYAKTDPGYDGYTANRRVLAVEWVLDDGTVVPQALVDARSVQTVPVDAITTTVRLRLVSVSEPAAGPEGRDFTAVSGVELLGAPGPVYD